MAVTKGSSLKTYFFCSVFNIFVDDEDGGGVVVEGLDVENFGFLDAHFEFPYPDFQNE